MIATVHFQNLIYYHLFCLYAGDKKIDLYDQFRKVTKSKSIFLIVCFRFFGNKTLEKMLFLAYFDLSKKWTAALRDWMKMIGQLAIAFEGRLNLNL